VVHLSRLALADLAKISTQWPPMAVALGLVAVWYPEMADLAHLPPQVAPMAVALGLVPALTWLKCPWPVRMSL